MTGGSIALTNAPVSHPSVQECLRDAKYTSFQHAKAVLDKSFQLRARICTDKGTARIAFKDSALMQYGEIWSHRALDPMQPIIPTEAHTSSSVDIGQPPPLMHDQYAKGKRPLEGGGRGQILKSPKVESSTDRNKGKDKYMDTHPHGLLITQVDGYSEGLLAVPNPRGSPRIIVPKSQVDALVLQCHEDMHHQSHIIEVYAVVLSWHCR
jgi:hypothetical protein